MNNTENRVKKILIIDDDPGGIDWILNSYGFKTEVITDAREGLKKLLTENSFDLAIIDLILPNMTGLSLLKKVRNTENLNKKLPIIIITAFNSSHNQVASLNSGADDYITKPYEVSNLIARIESILRRTEWSSSKEGYQDKDILKLPVKINLTDRQLEILRLLSLGYSNKSIAKALILSETTVKAHLRTIFKKLKVSNRTQAVFESIKLGIISEQENH